MTKQSKPSSAPTKRRPLAPFWARVLLTISILQFLPSTLVVQQRAFVVCQDFDQDLNIKLQPSPQQLFSRQAQTSPSNLNNRLSRPILSSRFAPNSSPIGGQQLSAQASSSASVFSAPPTSLQQQPTQQLQPQQASISQTSNIEQLMKNALSRTGAESRQDPAPASQPETINAVSKSALSNPTTLADKMAELSESQASGTASPLEDADKLTTAAQSATTGGHETVYSDQRFANLFARRNNLKRSKIQPTEQIKAKPTLPSFIRSPPDPKQFAAAQQAQAASERPLSGLNNQVNNAFASQRLQQQNQARIANQQKKPAITSNSAATANQKRNQTLNGKQTQTSSPSSRPNSNQKSGTSTVKPATAIVPNNPFGRSQNNSNDPANVIAMARKRLLANNALESAKLKKEQQSKQKETN